MCMRNLLRNCTCLRVCKRAYVRIYVCLQLAYFFSVFFYAVATAANKDVYITYVPRFPVLRFRSKTRSAADLE